MPKLFKIGGYWIYIWSNEGEPLEPVHIHVSEGKPEKDATKIWITRAGKCLKCHNKSRIPDQVLNNMMRMIELRVDYIEEKWIEHFGEITYFC